MKLNLKFFVQENGSVMVPGTGWCFPARGEKTPKNGACILIKEVVPVKKNGKSYGFYRWVPTDYSDPTEEELIAAYMLEPLPQYLDSQVEKMDYRGKPAIVLRYTSWPSHGVILNAISLNGWHSTDVTFSGETVGKAIRYPVVPLFEDKRTMLDILIKHGYGRLSDDEIFSALKIGIQKLHIIPDTLYCGCLIRADKFAYIKDAPDSYEVRPLIKGMSLGRPDEYDFGKYNDDNTARIITLADFIEDYISGKYNIPRQELHIPNFWLDARMAHELDIKAFRSLPATVQKWARSGEIDVDYMYPDFWYIQSTPWSFLRLCLFATEQELEEILRFAKTEWERSIQELKARDAEMAQLKPLPFTSIRHEADAPASNSQEFEDMRDLGAFKFMRAFGIDYIVDVNTDKLVANYTKEELHAIVAEINRINETAEKRVKSAIAKRKLLPDMVNLK